MATVRLVLFHLKLFAMLAAALYAAVVLRNLIREAVRFRRCRRKWSCTEGRAFQSLPGWRVAFRSDTAPFSARSNVERNKTKKISQIGLVHSCKARSP